MSLIFGTKRSQGTYVVRRHRTDYRFWILLNSGGEAESVLVTDDFGNLTVISRGLSPRILED